VIAYCLSALAGGTMFCRWWQVGEEEKEKMWSLYGWYSGLMALGSCFGMFSWIAKMLHLSNNAVAVDLFRQNIPRDIDWYNAETTKWQAMFAVSHALEFLCLSAAKLMVLDRMSDFAMPIMSDGTRKKWKMCGKVMMAVVVVASLTGLVGNAASADYWARSSEISFQLYNVAGNTAAAPNINTSTLSLTAQSLNNRALRISSAQSFSEFFVLLLIVVAFAVVGCLCLRRIKSISSLLTPGPGVGRLSTASDETAAAYETAAASEGRDLRRKIVFTTVFSFVVFLFRSIQAAIYALALLLSDFDQGSCAELNRQSLCSVQLCNMWTHMLRWNQRTPEFETVVVIISSPLALAVALWGMTTRSTIRIMKNEMVTIASVWR
jgi:hypothetical protein